MLGGPFSPLEVPTHEHPLLAANDDSGACDEQSNESRSRTLSLSQSFSSDDEPRVAEPALLLGARHAAVSLANSSIGAGVLALPAVMKFCGLGLGSVLVIVLALLSNFSLRLLVDTAAALPRSHWSYTHAGALAHRRWGPLAVDVCTLANNFGACVGYQAVLGDLLVPLAALVLPPGSVFAARSVLIVVVTCMCIAPLVARRELAALARFSLATLLVTLVVVAIIVFKALAAVSSRAPPAAGAHDAPDGPDGSDAVVFARLSPELLLALPIVTFAFSCHTNLHAVLVEMHGGEAARGADLRAAQGLRADVRARLVAGINAQAAFCLAVYLSIGWAGYWLFRDATQGDIFVNFSASDPVVSLMRALFALTLIGTYPMSAFPSRRALESMLSSSSVWTSTGALTRHVAVTCGLVLSTTVLAVGFPSILSIFALTGASAAMMTTFVLPAACALGQEPFSWRKAPALGLAVTGLVLGSLSTFAVLLSRR